MRIELKIETIFIIVTSVLLLAIGLITGWAIFLVLPAILFIAMLIDFTLIYLAGKQRNVKVRRSLSKDLLPLGSPVEVVTEIEYSGRRPRNMLIRQPTNSLIELMDSGEKTVLLRCGEPIRLAMTMRPGEKGDLIIEPLDVEIKSVFFNSHSPLGDALRLPVYPVLGLYAKRDAFHHNLRKALFGNEEISRGVFFVMDVDESMGIGSSTTELDAAISSITAIVNSALCENELTSMISFTKNGVIDVMLPGTGKDHAVDFSRLLYSIEPVSGDRIVSPPSYRTIGELDNLFAELAQNEVEPVVEVLRETCVELVNSIENSGFLKAVYQACQYADCPDRIVILTNLSMGMACLLEGIQVIQYYGHTATVILTPHVWFDEGLLGDSERFYERYREIKDAESKIRSVNTNVIVLGKNDSIEDLLYSDTTIVNATEDQG